MRMAVLLPLALWLASGARAAPDAGAPSAPDAEDAGLPDAGLLPREVPIEKVDGGYALELGWAGPGSGPDAGPAAALTPPELVVNSPAVYPASLREAAPSAEVKLELLIDEHGDVATVTVVKGDRPEFNEAAVHAATKLGFKPARLGDTPVPVRMFFTYRFEAPPAPKKVATGTIEGLVRTRGNRRPIPGAALSFKGLDRTIEADATGHFQVELPAGGGRVHVSAPGHKPEDFPEQLRPGETLKVIYGLEPLVPNPYETIVRGDRERTEVSRITLHAQELREVPGTLGDPFRVVMLLPGVSSILSGLSYPVVRGTEPAATGYYLDGIRVPILFHLFLGPAVVHPDYLETLDFYPGAPPPEFGRLLGGVVDGKISRARDDRLHATVYADLINAGLFVELPFEKTGTNITVAGRLSYTPWLVGLLANSVSADPNSRYVLDFSDYQARIEQKVGPGTLRLMAFGSSDVVGTQAVTDSGVTALSSVIFHRVDLRYRQPLGGGELEGGVTAGWDRLGLVTGELGGTGTFDLDETTYRGYVNWRGRILKDLKLEVGGDVEHRESPIEISVTQPPDPQNPGAPGLTIDLHKPVAVGTLSGAWAQATWTGVPRLALIPGLRVDSYHLVPGLEDWAFEPRLTVRYGLTDSLTLKGAAGLFHQPPTTLINLPAVDLGALRYGLQKGVQTDVGVEWKVLDGIDIAADAYFNPLLRTLELSPFAQLPPAQVGEGGGTIVGDVQAYADAVARSQLSRGYAYGFELLVRHPLGGNWFGWLAYTFQRSVRRREFPRYDEHGTQIGTDTGYLPFAYDQTHVLNAVLSYKLPLGWTVGGVFHFNTGRPEMGELTSTTHVPGTNVLGETDWIPVDLDKADRLPSFFRVDVRVSKTWIYDAFTLELYLDFLNVSFSKEVLSFTYDRTLSDPADPSAGYTLLKTPVAPSIFLPILGLKASY